MSQAPRKPPRDYDVTDDKALMLWGPPIRPDGFPIRGKFSFDENGPILTVDSGTKTDKGYKVDVEMPIMLANMLTVLNLIRRVASHQGGGLAFETDIYGHPWVYDRGQGKNVKSKEKLHVGRMLIEKRADGQVSLSVTARNKPEMRFDFKQNDYMAITQNGQPVSVDISSSEAALAWAEMWKTILVNKVERDWKEPEYKKEWRLKQQAERAQRNNGGGGGGGGQYQNRNNGGGGGGGGQQQYQQQGQGQSQAQAPAAPGHDSFDSFDEDLPY